MGKVSAASTNTHKLRVPEELSDHYSERAAKAGHDPEREMLKTLDRCRSYNDASPIYFTDSDRNELAVLTGRSLKTPAEVIGFVRELLSIRVQGVDIALYDQLIKRLDSRRFGQTWQEFLKGQVVRELETFVGLR